MRLSPVVLVQAYLRKVTQRRIFSGPFAGLFFTQKSVGSSYFPKLLGIYEKELHAVFEGDRPDFEKVIVIGAAEGYYAVGLAKKWKIPVIAFEASKEGRELLTRLALINRTNIFVQGKFTPSHDTRSVRDFILIDIEGEEKEVLTPERFLIWHTSTIIVEVHSDAIKGLLWERSKNTHEVNFIPVAKRTMKDYPFKPPFPLLLRRWWWASIQEWRSDSIGWLIFKPLK